MSNAPKECSVDKCSKAIFTKSSGLCPAHYQRKRALGDVLEHIPVSDKSHMGRRRVYPEICTNDYCNNKHYSRGLCSKHYLAWLRRRKHIDSDGQAFA